MAARASTTGAGGASVRKLHDAGWRTARRSIASTLHPGTLRGWVVVDFETDREIRRPASIALLAPGGALCRGDQAERRARRPCGVQLRIERRRKPTLLAAARDVTSLGMWMNAVGWRPARRPGR